MKPAKKFLPVFAFVSASLCAATPVQAGIISYDVDAAIAMTSLLNDTVTDGFSLDDASVSARSSDEDLYSLLFTDSFYTRRDSFHGDLALPGKQFSGVDPGATEFALLPANALFAASVSYDFGARDTDNGDMTFVPLIGPVPEPSIKWLMMGALLALAGLSRGTRGIHESV